MNTILHCDANNFYASVEIMLNPNLTGKPVAVSGNPEKRHGIILAKSTLAKNCGVKTGETIWQAKQKCRDLILCAPHYDQYVKFSNQLFEIYTQYTDKVEPFGIDECWLDCTNSLKLFKSGENIANLLRERVKKELGITISVGVSFTKIFAKLGSDIKKPDATTLITPQNYKEIVWTLPVGDLLMVGRKTEKFLNGLNIYNIGELATYNEHLLSSHLGINGAKLHAYANGIELDNVRYYYNHHIPESVGNSTTTPIDLNTESEASAVIVGLSEMVATRLRKHELKASSLALGIKLNNLTGFNIQKPLKNSTNNANEIAKSAMELLSENYKFSLDLPIRAISVTTFKLCNENDIHQINMFEDINVRSDKLEDTVDNIRKKYGYEILKKGIILAHKEICEDLVDDDFLPFKK